MEKEKLQYGEVVEEGITTLIGAFGAVIEELFKKPAIILKDASNPFADLPKHIQMSIVQGAFFQCAAQSIASVVMLAGGQLKPKEVFSASTMVLRHHFDGYLNQFREDYERSKGMDKRPKTGDDGNRIILDPGAQPKV